MELPFQWVLTLTTLINFLVRLITHDLKKCIVDYFLSHASQVYSINFLGDMMLHTINEDEVYVVNDSKHVSQYYYFNCL